MNIFGYVLICFIPLISFYFCLKLLINDFKWLQGIKAAALGVVAVVPIAAIQFGLDFLNTKYTSFQLTIARFFILGFVEESIKMLMLCFFSADKTKFKTFCAYAALVGISFACFEDFIYLINGLEHLEIRLLVTALVHAVCTVLSGIFVYSGKKRETMIIPLIFAVGIHGVYNYFCILPYPFRLFAFAAITFAILECRIQGYIYLNRHEQVITEVGAKTYLEANVDHKEEKVPETSAPEVTVSSTNTAIKSAQGSEKTESRTYSYDKKPTVTVNTVEQLESKSKDQTLYKSKTDYTKSSYKSGLSHSSIEEFAKRVESLNASVLSAIEEISVIEPIDLESALSEEEARLIEEAAGNNVASAKKTTSRKTAAKDSTSKTTVRKSASTSKAKTSTASTKTSSGTTGTARKTTTTRKTTATKTGETKTTTRKTATSKTAEAKSPTSKTSTRKPAAKKTTKE